MSGRLKNWCGNTAAFPIKRLPKSRGLSPEMIEIEDRMRSVLGTKVSLHPGQKGGSITIHYFSDEELNRLIDQILKG